MLTEIKRSFAMSMKLAGWVMGKNDGPSPKSEGAEMIPAKQVTSETTLTFPGLRPNGDPRREFTQTIPPLLKANSEYTKAYLRRLPEPDLLAHYEYHIKGATNQIYKAISDSLIEKEVRSIAARSHLQILIIVSKITTSLVCLMFFGMIAGIYLYKSQAGGLVVEYSLLASGCLAFAAGVFSVYYLPMKLSVHDKCEQKE